MGQYISRQPFYNLHFYKKTQPFLRNKTKTIKHHLYLLKMYKKSLKKKKFRKNYEFNPVSTKFLSLSINNNAYEFITSKLLWGIDTLSILKKLVNFSH